MEEVVAKYPQANLYTVQKLYAQYMYANQNTYGSFLEYYEEDYQPNSELTMRTRETIEEQAELYHESKTDLYLILEILLDIRGLLSSAPPIYRTPEEIQALFSQGKNSVKEDRCSHCFVKGYCPYEDTRTATGNN